MLSRDNNDSMLVFVPIDNCAAIRENVLPRRRLPVSIVIINALVNIRLDFQIIPIRLSFVETKNLKSHLVVVFFKTFFIHTNRVIISVRRFIVTIQFFFSVNIKRFANRE